MHTQTRVGAGPNTTAAVEISIPNASSRTPAFIVYSFFILLIETRRDAVAPDVVELIYSKANAHILSLWFFCPLLLLPPVLFFVLLLFFHPTITGHGYK